MLIFKQYLDHFFHEGMHQDLVLQTEKYQQNNNHFKVIKVKVVS